MDIEEIFLDDDDMDIQILSVSLNNESATVNNKPIIKKDTVKSNPVEEHLIKQLNCAQNQIDQAKSNIEVIESVTEKILQNLASQAAYRDADSSDSDNDMYLSTGEPVITKKKNNRFYERNQVLVVGDTWQRIIDDKWIIGVILQNSTTCTLKEPTIYVCLKNQNDSSHGVSAFWSLVNETYWVLCEEIDSEETVMATAILDLPSFDETAEIEAHGTIFCQIDEKMFQTPFSSIKLNVKNTVDNSCALDFDTSEGAQLSTLALKAVSVDRVIVLPMQEESNIGKRLVKFLDMYNFKELNKTCCVLRNVGSLQFCILEILPTDDDGDLKILLSAKSEAQLSAAVQLVRINFPELIDVEKQQAIDEAAEALKNELKLYLTCKDAAKLQRARITTDLLIP